MVGRGEQEFWRILLTVATPERGLLLEQTTLLLYLGTPLLYSPVRLDLKQLKRALKVSLRPSTSGCLGDENGLRGLSVLGCL